MNNENQPSNPVTIVQVASPAPTPPESNNSPEQGQSEQSGLLQLGAVLEAHRNLTERTQAQEQRLEALEGRLGGMESGQQTILSRLDQMLVQQVEVEEEVADVVEVMPERAEEEEPEEEPVKPRSGLKRAIFG